jgi:hypothetical protein
MIPVTPEMLVVNSEPTVIVDIFLLVCLLKEKRIMVGAECQYPAPHRY